MKKLVFTLVLLSCIKVFSNDTTYYSVLRNSINNAYSNYTVEAYQQLSNTCERIIPVTKNEWLPYYYKSYANIQIAYMLSNEDEKTKYCNKAQSSLDSAMKIKPDDSENYIVQALIYYGKMQVNQMVSGPMYFPKSQDVLERAESLNPSNPRVFYVTGQSKMNTPKFFGGGKELALPYFEKAIKLFDEFKYDNNLYPAWGESHNLKLYNDCKAEVEKTADN